MRLIALAACAASIALPALAQEQQETQDTVSGTAAPAIAPMAIQARAQSKPTYELPANTEVTLSMNQEVTTKGRTWSEGDTFNLSVVHDVMLGDYVVIPKGSRGVGRITWLTSKGAFGKSGKMDIELEYIEVNGRRIDISGTYRQEGEGNTVATVGGVIAAGIFAGFITGKSGRIPAGRELIAHTDQAIPVSLPEGATPIRASNAIQAVEAKPVPEALPVTEASVDVQSEVEDEIEVEAEAETAD